MLRAFSRSSRHMIKDRRKPNPLIAFLMILTLAFSWLIPTEVDARSSKSSGKSSHKSSKKTRSSHKRSKRKRGHYKRRRKHKAKKKWHAPLQLGILIQSPDGKIITDKHSDKSFNPASAIKLLTAYGALKELGPAHQFTTELYMDGALDEDSGILDGNLYVQGNDPEFGKTDSYELVKALAAQGVKQVKGKLVVSKDFSLYCNGNARTSGQGLSRIFKYGMSDSKVLIDGGVELGSAPESAIVVLKHDSESLRSTLKHMLSKSLNSAAERIGSVIGGVPKLKEIATDDLGIPEESIKITSASGLGQNRITPKHMMKVLRALGEELERHNLSYQSIMPVAGIDNGTLEKRFTSEDEKGSVVAKTGTLTHTDGGVSALVGVMRSQKEDLYFVMFGWHGGVHGMRKNQDVLIKQLQQERGGPKSFAYNH